MVYSLICLEALNFVWLLLSCVNVGGARECVSVFVSALLSKIVFVLSKMLKCDDEVEVSSP